MANQFKQFEKEFLRGTDEVIPLTETLALLDSGKKLKIKLGCDPTAADLHLGHSVVLNKLRLLQDHGHVVQFIIGGFYGSHRRSYG